MNGKKPEVLFIGDLNKSLPEYQQFEQKFECLHYEITTKEQLIHDFQTKFKNVQAIYGAWLGFVLIGGFRDEILENSPPNLKIIAVCSVGYDPYDCEKMAQRNIILTNVPSEGAANPVADLVLYNTLTSFRSFHVYQAGFTPDRNHTVAARKTLEQSSLDGPTGKLQLVDDSGYSFGHFALQREVSSPRNHNAVIVGFGRIGQLIGKKLSDIGMKIHYVKRSKLPDDQESKLPYNATYHKNLYDTRQFADLVVIACPGTPETKHLVDAKIISSFTKPVRIINIGRGSVIDEQALVDGLKSGKVVFAGLDVFEDEPKVHPDLFGRNDVVLTPHIGASTVENFDFTAVRALHNITSVLEGGNPIDKVN